MRTNPDNTELDKARGLIFGLSRGDALGYVVPPALYVPILEKHGGKDAIKLHSLLN